MIDLEQMIEVLGVSKADLARYFEVRPNTVTEWCKSEPPKSVVLHLECLIYFKEKLRSLRNG